jgi:hypothetical protein
MLFYGAILTTHFTQHRMIWEDNNKWCVNKDLKGDDNDILQVPFSHAPEGSALRILNQDV